MMNKSSADQSSNPLHNVGILQTVLSYVGPGHHLFIAPVSKCWKDIYTSGTQKLAVYAVNSCEKTNITCVSGMTLFSSVFASPSRVELAHQSGLDWAAEACQHAAGRYADIATLATAHTLGMQFTETTMAGAAQRNKLAEVQYLHGRGSGWLPGLLDMAVSCGYFELVRWCHEHGCRFCSQKAAPSYAAESGNIELLVWVLRHSGSQLSTSVMWAAAAKGRRAMCQYLHEQQCPWDFVSTRRAAEGGHIDLLRWLMDNGCPWRANELCVSAAQGGSVQVLMYLQQRGLAMFTTAAMLTDMLDYAGAFNRLAAAQWSREQGAEWPTVLRFGVWGSDVLAWAVAEGFTPSTRY
jgi:hypothetical protein